MRNKSFKIFYPISNSWYWWANPCT